MHYLGTLSDKSNGAKAPQANQYNNLEIRMMKAIIAILIMITTVTATASHKSGYYKNVCKRVWMPAKYKKVWVSATYKYQLSSSGHYEKIITCEGHYATKRIQGYYINKNVRVWFCANRSRR